MVKLGIFSVFGDGKSVIGSRFLDVLFVIVVFGGNLYFFGDKVRRVEINIELIWCYVSDSFYRKWIK